MAFGRRTIDKKDHNAKILKNKQQAKNIASIANRLLEKEEKKVLESNDLENFRLIIGRNPKKGSTLEIKRSPRVKSTVEYEKVSKEESRNFINALLKENNRLYKKVKSRGYALEIEKLRHREILMELMRRGFFEEL